MTCMTQIRHLGNYFKVIIPTERKGNRIFMFNPVNAYYADMTVRVCNLFTCTCIHVQFQHAVYILLKINLYETL